MYVLWIEFPFNSRVWQNSDSLTKILGYPEECSVQMGARDMRWYFQKKKAADVAMSAALELKISGLTVEVLEISNWGTDRLAQ